MARARSEVTGREAAQFMKNFSEAEKQSLIAAGWLKSRYGLMAGFSAAAPATLENLRKFGEI